MPFIVRVLVSPSSLDPKHYLKMNERGAWLRFFESFSSLRVLKFCKYYEASGLLVHAINISTGQLLVPLFMLLLMVVIFSTLIVELEFDEAKMNREEHRPSRLRLLPARCLLSLHTNSLPTACHLLAGISTGCARAACPQADALLF